MVTPPQDLDAEQTVVGAALTDRRCYEAAGLTGAEFYRPAHELVWRAIGHLIDKGSPADPVAVRAHLEASGDAGRVGGAPYLADLLHAAPVGGVASVGHYAGIVANHATNRRTLDALTSAAQLVEAGGDSEKLLEEAERKLAAVPSGDSGEVDTLMTLDEFVDRDLGPVRWVIPGLLAREERLIVTAAEGIGKSTFIRQLGVCAAAGMAPLSGRPFDPVKVLIVDAENSERMMVDWYAALRTSIRGHGHDTAGRLWIDRRGGGMNLADAADRRWLTRRVQAVQPDMLVIGPAYKLHKGGTGRESEEAIARGVTDVLDEIRGLTGCAIVLEHHSAKGEGRARTIEPFGSSLWMRWPEFGVGLRKSEHPAADARRMVDVQHWRGPRSERLWPDRLESGGTRLPWVVSAL